MATCNLCGVKMDGGCSAFGCPHRQHRTSFPVRTLTDAQLTALIRAARVANPLHSPVDVEEPPRDAQPARLSGEVL